MRGLAVGYDDFHPGKMAHSDPFLGALSGFKVFRIFDVFDPLKGVATEQACGEVAKEHFHSELTS